MVHLRRLRIWLGWVVFFFAWGFVVHGAEFLLHEVAGHGVAAMVFGCGVDRIDMTYFGPAITFYTPCPKDWVWTWARRVMVDSAGFAVTIGAGAVVMALQRRAWFAPLTRLLLALLATWFLLGQLAYATWGGFHDVEDPALVARTLAVLGLHFLAWLPTLVLYAVAAAFGGRAIIDAFREHFGSRSRAHALKQMVATLGAAGLLYFIAFRVESTTRVAAGIWRGVSDRFEQSAAAQAAAVQAAAAQSAAAQTPTPPFPIHRVLFAIAIAAFVVALARPVIGGDGARDSERSVPRRHAIGVAVATLVCFVAITLLAHVRAVRAGI